jgi:uroporphyrin-III C-methyltransferase/precorrin-2 dehydrogenase/sirohydrochlorin ferrochelatase
MHFLPVFLDLHHGRVALIGSGPAAANKLRLLQSAGAQVRWYAADPGAIAGAGASAGQIEVCTDDPRAADFSSFIAVVAAAGDELDDTIAARARRHNVPVNVVDRADLSTFIFPAIVDRGDVVVAIGTGGASPVLARRLRERIEALLPARIGDLAALMNRFRRPAALARRGAGSLRGFWERVIDGPIAAAALAGRWREAETALARAAAHPEAPRPQTGVVTLAGAGPGDADLLTLRALHALQAADVIFYDELVTPEILDRARRDAERVFVGKRSGRPGVGQGAINQKLAEAARSGLNVVRLKGGDPFIFGRGGEELDYLRRAGIAVEVVPGITAALGCAADAGLPLTFRSEATRVIFISAHQADIAARTDWSGCADRNTTLVIYMGLGKAAAVRDGLIAAGRGAETPAAVLVRGTRPDAEYLFGRLDEIAVLAAQAGDGPGLLVVGEVVTHATAWPAIKQHLALTEMAA